jgi:hypothetical protein
MQPLLSNPREGTQDRDNNHKTGEDPRYQHGIMLNLVMSQNVNDFVDEPSMG